MDFKKELKRLHESKEFKEWQLKNKSSYLVHGFLMLKGDNKTPWQIGYYNKDNDKITSFFLEEQVKVSPESEVFKKEGVVEKIDPDKIKVSLEKALETAKKKMPTPSDIVVVIQNLPIGQVWNITFLVQAIAQNFKIDTSSGKIIEQKQVSFFQPKSNKNA